MGEFFGEDWKTLPRFPRRRLDRLTAIDAGGVVTAIDAGVSEAWGLGHRFTARDS